MTRQITPDLLAAQPAPAEFNLVQAMTAAPIAPALRYDYAALGTAGESVRRHVLAFKSAEKRMAENTIAAGIELIAIRETIPHAHWLPLLADELGMGERAAQVLMQTARRFGAKAQTYADLTPSVLALLAPASVPDAAIEAAIAANAASPITVTAAKAIIAAHRPASLRHAQGKCRVCKRTLTDPDAIRAGIGSCCAAKLVQGAAAGEAGAEAQALPEWVTVDEPSAIVDSAPAPSPAPPLHESAPQGETHADSRGGAGKAGGKARGVAGGDADIGR